MSELIFTVKCVSCGTKREMSAEETANMRADEVPMCKKCFMPCVVDKVKYEK